MSLMKAGYTLLMFPEGKRVSSGRLPAKPGVTIILNSQPQAKVIISHIEWRSPTRLSDIQFQNYKGKKQSEDILDAVYYLEGL